MEWRTHESWIEFPGLLGSKMCNNESRKTCQNESPETTYRNHKAQIFRKITWRSLQRNLQGKFLIQV